MTEERCAVKREEDKISLHCNESSSNFNKQVKISMHDELPLMPVVGDINFYK